MGIRDIKVIFDENRKFVVYGAGLRGEAILRTLKACGTACLAVIDANPDKQGTLLHGIPIVSKSEIQRINQPFSIIVSVAGGESIVAELSKDYDVVPLKIADYIIRLSYLNCEDYGFNSLENIGSYMSPYPDANNYQINSPISDIDFNYETQKNLFEYFMKLYNNIDKNSCNGRRYYEDNTKYGIIDALVLYGMIQHIQPNRIIEIGSGFSSSIMLDTSEYCFDNRIELEFIEPYPQRLKKLLKQTDNISLHECFLQELNSDVFNNLEANDILFVDSSHMVKMGADVNKIFFEVLPNLKSGVYIHFHDIFRNFEYPEEWIRNGWVWNECYLLRAFLMNNNDYEVIFFCDQWNKKFQETGMFNQFVGGGSIWIRKK